MRCSCLWLLAIGIFPVGCTDFGACNLGTERAGEPGTAFEVVYDADGIPAYAGQALAIRSCGGGGYCHSEGIDLASRNGAPGGLNFDVRLASTGSDLNPEGIARQRRGADALDHGLVWSVVSSQRMPPGGAGTRIIAESAVHFDRLSISDHTYTPLPELDTAAGRDIFRNWLACRAPLIERTQLPLIEQNVDAMGMTRTRGDAGDIVDEANPPRRCADVTWPSLYATVIQPRCALSACHSGDPGISSLSFDATMPTDLAAVNAVATRLIGQHSGPTSQLCGMTTGEPAYVTPGESMQSLLYLKVQEMDMLRTCGARMPLEGSYLPAQRICALKAWIDCGACTDMACMSTNSMCLDNARRDCMVDDTCVVHGTTM